MRLVMVGTGEFALPTFQRLLARRSAPDAGGYEIVALLTLRPRISVIRTTSRSGRMSTCTSLSMAAAE